MGSKLKRRTAAVLAICAIFSIMLLAGCRSGDEEDGYRTALDRVQKYLYETVNQPVCGSTGGEWTIVGLVQGGFPVDAEYISRYTSSVEETVQNADGILNTATGYKYTEYSRIILGWTAAGRNPSDVAGYNFIAKLSDMENICRQGINGPIWALIALDCGGYEPVSDSAAAEQTSREAIIRYILDMQLPDGGWNLTGDEADADLTAMALTAMAPYYTADNELCVEISEETLQSVQKAVSEGLLCLSDMQTDSGDFESWSTVNSESCSQVITALSSLEIDGNSDERFVKPGGSVLDALLRFQMEDGSFSHTPETGSNLMASEQAAYALASYDRLTKGEPRLFDMR